MTRTDDTVPGAAARDGAGARTGSRLRCTVCGTEIVVVRPPSAGLVCCGAPMGSRSAS